MSQDSEGKPDRDDPVVPRDAVVKTIVISASPEHVFTFFTDPARMLRWIGTAVELDPRPGGLFRVMPNGVDVIVGKFLELTPPSRVVFTWGFEGSGQALPAGASIVEVTLRAVPGGTEVRLVHRSLPEDMIERHDFGWQHYIARIASAAEGRDPGPDPWADPAYRHDRGIDRGVSQA
jgi:uncharacterized protein YndB with AHSA1/START domain